MKSILTKLSSSCGGGLWIYVVDGDDIDDDDDDDDDEDDDENGSRLARTKSRISLNADKMHAAC